jgi:hypothetical protein
VEGSWEGGRGRGDEEEENLQKGIHALRDEDGIKCQVCCDIIQFFFMHIFFSGLSFQIYIFIHIFKYTILLLIIILTLLFQVC